MTHDELLAKIDASIATWQILPALDGFPINETATFRKATAIALRAVVELTRKYEDFDGVDSAGMSGYRLAMKAVIQAIEKELE